MKLPIFLSYSDNATDALHASCDRGGPETWHTESTNGTALKEIVYNVKRPLTQSHPTTLKSLHAFSHL